MAKQKRTLSSTIGRIIGSPANKSKVSNFRVGTTTSGSQIQSFNNNGVVIDDIFLNSTEKIASEISKVTVSHVDKMGNEIPGALNDYVLKYRPNDTQSMSQFISYIITQRQQKYNSYIIVRRDEVTNSVIGLLPVVDIVKVAIGFEHAREVIQGISSTMENAGQELPVDDETSYFFDVGGGNILVEPQENVIHLRRNYGTDSYFGGLGALGGQYGDYETLLRLLKIKRAVEEGIEVGALNRINGIVKLNGNQGQESTREALKDLEQILNESKNGFIALDNKVESIQMLGKDNNTIDDSLIKYLDEKIARISGVPIEVLNGNSTRDVHNSFYQNTIEPIVAELENVFTLKLLSKAAIMNGEKIQFYVNKLQFMDSGEILEMTRQFGDSGTITENEKRQLVGLIPLRELDGVIKKNNAWSDATNSGVAYDKEGNIIK